MSPATTICALTALAAGVLGAVGVHESTASMPPSEPDLGRVVALGEEALLADLLTVGITPIASSATVAEVGFQGIEPSRVDGIEVLPMTTLDLEVVAALQPDTIITYQFWVDQVGGDLLAGLAELIIVPDGLTGTTAITTIGELVGRSDVAAERATALEDVIAAGRSNLDARCDISLASIYAGPSVAAFVDGPWLIPSTLIELGCSLTPDPSAGDADQNGRLWLSPELYGVLDAPVLVLLQTPTVEGESAAVDELADHPVWRRLPAVDSGAVLTFDRLGYPGVDGAVRFVDDFVTAFDEVSTGLDVGHQPK